MLNKKNNLRLKNKTFLSFFRKSKFIFRSNNLITNVHAFVLRKLCIFKFLVDEIFNTIHDAANEHNDFHKCYERLIFSYFIRNLFFQLRVYLRHYSDCQIHQTRQYKSYDFLHPILSPSIPFHILTINFILALLKTKNDFDIKMFVTCKHNKRIICILKKII